MSGVFTKSCAGEFPKAESNNLKHAQGLRDLTTRFPLPNFLDRLICLLFHSSL